MHSLHKVVKCRRACVVVFGIGVLVVLTVVSRSRDKVDVDKSIFHRLQRMDSVSTPTRNNNLTGFGVLMKDRILCIILTSPHSKEKMVAVHDTWSKRCDRRLFVLAGKFGTQYLNKSVLFVDTSEDRDHLTDKVILAFKHVHDNFLNSFEWIVKADDDSYFIIENLRRLLSQYNPKKPGYIGCHFKKHMRNGYMSGGAGYVISHAAFEKLCEKCFYEKNFYKKLSKDEDVSIGKLLQSVNVPVLSSLDLEKHETFHPEPLENHLVGPWPKWLENYSWNSPKFGEECCSELSVSFHHLSDKQIYLYEHLLYRTSVYGKKSTHDRLIFLPEVTVPREN